MGNYSWGHIPIISRIIVAPLLWKVEWFWQFLLNIKIKTNQWKLTNQIWEYMWRCSEGKKVGSFFLLFFRWQGMSLIQIQPQRTHLLSEVESACSPKTEQSPDSRQNSKIENWAFIWINDKIFFWFTSLKITKSLIENVLFLSFWL